MKPSNSTGREHTDNGRYTCEYYMPAVIAEIINPLKFAPCQRNPTHLSVKLYIM
jgi:hypothetical protein